MSELSATGEIVIVEIVTDLGQLQSQTKKKSGILIPDNIVQAEPKQGRVYKIGPDVPADRGYDIGDTVVFGKPDVFNGFKWEGKDLVDVKHSEIMATLKEDS